MLVDHHRLLPTSLRHRVPPSTRLLRSGDLATRRRDLVICPHQGLISSASHVYPEPRACRRPVDGVEPQRHRPSRWTGALQGGPVVVAESKDPDLEGVRRPWPAGREVVVFRRKSGAVGRDAAKTSSGNSSARCAAPLPSAACASLTPGGTADDEGHRRLFACSSIFSPLGSAPIRRRPTDLGLENLLRRRRHLLSYPALVPRSRARRTSYLLFPGAAAVGLTTPRPVP